MREDWKRADDARRAVLEILQERPMRHCELGAAMERRGWTNAHRTVDRACQTLRRLGEVVVERGVWRRA